MAANPQVFQGTLNRLRGSIIVPGNTALNITNSYLGRAGISIRFEGEVTTMLPQMTGLVTSPMPYQQVSITAALLKSQSLASIWEAQRQTLSTIGNIEVTTDTSILPTYVFNNCAIGNVDALHFAGDDATYPLTIVGYYQINNNLWNLT